MFSVTMSDDQQKPCQRLLSKRVAVFCVLLTTIVLYCVFNLQVNTETTELPVPLSCSPLPDQLRARLTSNGSADECVPKTDLMFMKTHKTASSTFLNILFRFGEKHRLRFAFPSSRNDFFYPSYFHRTYIRGFKSGTCFNLMCNHMRFHADEVAKVLPRDTSYVTILRDPAELFESAFHYFSHVIPLTWSLPGDDKMAAFLRDPDLYFSPNGFNSFYLKNLLFFDFGQDNTLEADDPQVDEGIGLIDQRFHLVMLTEHFEESLILLKDALCWDLDDVLFFKLNSRQESTVSKLTPELRDKALQWNAVDWKLYRHFNRTFWEKVAQYGTERMAEDVAELRRRNAKMAKICIEGGRAVTAEGIREDDMRPWQPIGEKSIMGYNMNKNLDKDHEVLCRKMLTPEIQYLSELGVNLWLTKLLGRVRDIINW